MRLVVQRVRRGKVTVLPEGGPGGSEVGTIDQGLVILVGFKTGDDITVAARMARKVVELRIFEDAAGKMNRSVAEMGGSLLVVSQFTLYGDCRKGRRPSFTEAMPPEEARALYRRFVELLAQTGLTVASGEFGARMEVEIINDGPVTLLLEEPVAASQTPGG